MANIFITSKCNLKCPYCFADEFVNKGADTVTIENFKKIVDFIQTVQGERVGIIGGEPALHPQFNEILDILLENEKIEHFVVFSNGLEIDKYIDKLKSEKCAILVNCNSSKDIGISGFNKLKKNIELFSEAKKNKEDFNLGINLYSKDLDYSYIFELLQITGNHNLRFSTALPNTSKENSNDALKDFEDFRPYLFKFFKDCLDREIVPSSDCNGIPHCLLSIEDKRTLLLIKAMTEKYKIPDTISSIHTCSPVIDILPDLYAVRCFGLSKYKKALITDFKNIQALRAYFYNEIDLYARLSYSNRDCMDCKSHYLDKCGMCYTFKLNDIRRLKDYVYANTPEK